MRKRKKVDTRELGLELGMIIGKFFFNCEHLHFGYWTKELPVNIQNLHQAQDNHSQFIISHIPEGVKTILDVGCGIGKFAFKLTQSGYRVDGVSPSSVFAEHARNLLGKKSHIFVSRFEDLQTENRYNLILFSESFQYVDLESALQNSVNLLKEGGYLLVCDFFKTDAKGKSNLRGGHKLSGFYDLISQYPLKLIKDIDITKETAPNLSIVNDFLTHVGLPIWNSGHRLFNMRYPFIYKCIQWKYQKKIEKINQKYFSGTRNAENFAIFKSYRFFLYQIECGIIKEDPNG